MHSFASDVELLSAPSSGILTAFRHLVVGGPGVWIPVVVGAVVCAILALLYGGRFVEHL